MFLHTADACRIRQSAERTPASTGSGSKTHPVRAEGAARVHYSISFIARLGERVGVSAGDARYSGERVRNEAEDWGCDVKAACAPTLESVTRECRDDHKQRAYARSNVHHLGGRQCEAAV